MELRTRFTLRGEFTPEHWRPMENLTRVEQGLVLAKRRFHGAPYGLIHVQKSSNIVTDEGLDCALNSLLGNDNVATWYLALVETDTSPAAGMTYAVPVFTESTAYDEANRVTYVDVPSSGQMITNSASPGVFTISDTKSFYGGAMMSFATKGNTAEAGAILLCYSKFPVQRDLVDDDVLNMTYVMNAADA